MLVSADYDTHDCIKNFACYPGDREALALECLLRRTELRLAWDMGAVATKRADIGNMLCLRLGILHKEHSLHPVCIKDMSEEERVDLYVQLCKESGIDVTAEDLLKSANGVT